MGRGKRKEEEGKAGEAKITPPPPLPSSSALYSFRGCCLCCLIPPPPGSAASPSPARPSSLSPSPVGSPLAVGAGSKL